MNSIFVGGRVAIDTDGKSFVLLGVVASIDGGVATVRLDEGQPVADSATGTNVVLFVEDAGKVRRVELEVLLTRASESLLRLVKRKVVLGRERRKEERVPFEQPILWSPLGEDGQMGDQRHGLTRDVSLSGLAFETINSPPTVSSMIAISGIDPQRSGVLLAQVMGVGDAPSKRRRHVVRCLLKQLDEGTKAHIAALVSAGVETS